MYLRQGQQLNHGKYTIQQMLGQGGFGITYLATTADGGQVAVKEFFMKDACMREADSMRVTVPTEGVRADVERYRKKFIKEANNLLRLRHPNIVEVYEVFEENDTDYYAMQYMPGGSLRDHVMQHGPMDEPTARSYILQVASALRYMHERKHLCHYDVKPGNILIDGEGQAMLIDFGLSKNYDGSGQQTSSTPVGISAGYAPIEQYRQSLSEFSPATDVYALGATLYFLLTAQNPPEASVVLEQGLPRGAGISDSLWQVITKAMQPVRQQRYQSMAELVRALEYETGQDTVAMQTASVQEPPTATVVQADTPQAGNQVPPPYVEYPSQPKDNSKTALWALLGLLAVGVVVAIVMMMSKNEKTPAPDVWDGPTPEEIADSVAANAEEWEENVVDSAAMAAPAYEEDAVAEENPIDVTEHMDWSGAFIINGKRYPVRLSFYERYDYVLNSEADYTNVNAGTRLTMRAEKNGSCYEFNGSDGSYPLHISVCETGAGHYEGTASGQFSAQAVFDKR